MTAPDVAALRDALATATGTTIGAQPLGGWYEPTPFAEAIIAALAALGWRITSDAALEEVEAHLDA